MPLGEFYRYVEAINKVVELDTGKKEEESLTGKAGAEAANRMFRKKK